MVQHTMFFQCDTNANEVTEDTMFSEGAGRYFLSLHASKPEIYEAFSVFTKELIVSGVKKCSSHVVMERVRWESLINGKPIRVGNYLVKYFARLWEHNNPVYKGFFSRRIGSF